MGMKRYIIIAVIAIAVVATLMVVIKAKEGFDSMKRLEEKGVGKNPYIVIDQGQIADYNYLSSGTAALWKRAEREKMSQYMKDNNFKLVAGKYVINQTTTYEEALKIFKFEKIE